MIDNSGSMSDKQQILETAVPDLVDRLVNPLCVDAQGQTYPAAPPGQACPEGRFREFRPLSDINVGIISSSLGDAGAADACTSGPTVDGAHLLGSLPRAPGLTNEWGFLEWREGSDAEAFKGSFQRLVRAVGEDGCGWEASLESWYRFLIDPVPFEELTRTACGDQDTEGRCVAPVLQADGQPLLDEGLLRQRNQFLRPDSLLAIVMLTDENDCSVAPRGQSWWMTDTRRTMFAASAACAENPNDECCFSCLQQEVPPQCEWARSACAGTDERPENFLAAAEDESNLRCFDQKRRFGYDFLYPTERYVNALTEPRLCPSRPDLAVEDCPGAVLDNPLFAAGRSPASVFLAAIVGVPWQAISTTTDSTGNPLPSDVLRFRPATDLTESDWEQLIGASQESPPIPPASPLMRESTTARQGVTTGGPNGREYDTRRGSQAPRDLQYSCIFPLPESRTCREGQASCDCSPGSLDSPLCEIVPGESTASNEQHWAKAYPGLRHLEVLRGYGENSILASICARNVDEPERADFGYRPAIASIVDRLKDQLTQRCLPRPVEIDTDGSIPCSLVEARAATASACTCDAARARTAPGPLVDRATRQRLFDRDLLCDPGDPSCRDVCLCQVDQILLEPALSQCQNEIAGSASDGWCYVADTPQQSVGNPQLVQECPASERQLLRIVGEGVEDDSIAVITCFGRSYAGR